MEAFQIQKRAGKGWCGDRCRISRLEVCVCFSILAVVVGAILWFSFGFTHGMKGSTVVITDKTDYSFVDQTTKMEDQTTQTEGQVTQLDEDSVPFIPETVPLPEPQPQPQPQPQEDENTTAEMDEVTPTEPVVVEQDVEEPEEEAADVMEPEVSPSNNPFPIKSSFFEYYSNGEADKADFILENVLYRAENNFIEGFYYDKKTKAFYESAGLYKKSKVQRLIADPQTNKLKIDEASVQRLADRYFGEGLAPRSETEFALLTYKSRVMMTVSRETMKLLGLNFSIPEEIREGWGFTADESSANENGYYTMYASDGTHNIFTINGETMKVEKTTKIWNPFTRAYQVRINELEFVDGFIYANVWYKDVLLKIDPSTGNVVKQYNIEALQWAEEDFQRDTLNNTYKGDCLNGIAYDATTESFYLTGKKYHLVFKVKLL